MLNKIVLVVLTTLVSCFVTNLAVARTANSNLCNLTLHALRHDGFSEHAAYNVDSLQRLLHRAGVIVDLIGWDPNQLYEVSYSCKMEHGVTYPSLIATPLNTPAAIPGVIRWDATPPAT